MIITICGSSKYKYEICNFGSFMPKDAFILYPTLLETDKSKYTDKEFKILQAGLMNSHFHKIDIADVVLICNFDGYIGTSVTEELTYAYAKNKPVVMLFHDSDKDEITRDNLATAIVQDYYNDSTDSPKDIVDYKFEELVSMTYRTIKTLCEK